MRKVPFLFLILFTPIVVLIAQADHSSPFTGSWKLNVSKSHFNPGPGPKSETVTLSPDGRTTLNDVDAEGKSSRISYAWSGGAEVPIEGMKDATALDRFQGRTLDHTMKTGNTTLVAHGVLSKDGQTLKFTATSKDRGGQATHSVWVYEKQ